MPALFTSIFATGVKWGWADGHLVWFIIVAMGLGLTIATFFIPEAAEGRAEGKIALEGDRVAGASD